MCAILWGKNGEKNYGGFTDSVLFLSFFFSLSPHSILNHPTSKLQLCLSMWNNPHILAHIINDF